MLKALKLLNPQPLIGGVEISDHFLRYLILKGGQPKFYSVKLDPGIVIEGKLQNKDAFLKALLNLRQQITKKAREKLFVILNISAANVYSQIFDLPKVAEENLEEAAQLNLQMISPISTSEAYYDCQKIGENLAEGKIEIAGAFIYKNIIDDFSEVFLKANFVVVAVEFLPLAIARVMKDLAVNFDNQAPYIVFYLSSDGLNFLIVKNSNLYFNYFTSWRSLKGEKRYLSLDEFRAVIIEETKKILSFYNRNWSEPIKSFILMAQGLNSEVKEIITKEFSLTTEEVTLKKFNQVGQNFFPALGSALRGQIDRSEDTIISLASTGTEVEFRRQMFIAFIHLWQKIAFSFLIFIIASLSVTDVFLSKRLTNLQNDKNSINFSNQEGFNNLQSQAKDFNKKVALLSAAKKEIYPWSEIFSKIKDIASQNNVEIIKISVESDQKSVIISAKTMEEKNATGFKQGLINDPQFKDIILPLASIQTGPDKSISFYLNFKLE